MPRLHEAEKECLRRMFGVEVQDVPEKVLKLVGDASHYRTKAGASHLSVDSIAILAAIGAPVAAPKRDRIKPQAE